MKPAATAKNAQNPLYAPNTTSATATIPIQQEALTSRNAGRPNQPPPARAPQVSPARRRGAALTHRCHSVHAASNTDETQARKREPRRSLTRGITPSATGPPDRSALAFTPLTLLATRRICSNCGQRESTVNGPPRSDTLANLPVRHEEARREAAGGDHAARVRENAAAPHGRKRRAPSGEAAANATSQMAPARARRMRGRARAVRERSGERSAALARRNAPDTTNSPRVSQGNQARRRRARRENAAAPQTETPRSPTHRCHPHATRMHIYSQPPTQTQHTRMHRSTTAPRGLHKTTQPQRLGEIWRQRC